MTDRPTPPPGTPPGSLYWTVTGPDGTVVRDGWAAPIASGGGAGQGQDTQTGESSQQEANRA